MASSWHALGFHSWEVQAVKAFAAHEWAGDFIAELLSVGGQGSSQQQSVGFLSIQSTTCLWSSSQTFSYSAITHHIASAYHGRQENRRGFCSQGSMSTFRSFGWWGSWTLIFAHCFNFWTNLPSFLSSTPKTQSRNQLKWPIFASFQMETMKTHWVWPGVCRKL